jgi:hypothetical protein
MGVPDFDAQFKISKCEIQDIQPKFDLPQLWVHVEGVPHSLRHFHGLWAIGSLLGTTVDVDLPTLYSQNVVRVLVAMMSPDMLNKHQDEKGHIVDVTVTLKLQGYDFRCRKQKAGFQPDSSYSPLFWRGKEDGLEEEDPNTANGNGSLPLLNGASSSQVLSMDIDGARSSSLGDGSSKASMQASMTVDGAAIGGGLISCLQLGSQLRCSMGHMWLVGAYLAPARLHLLCKMSLRMRFCRLPGALVGLEVSHQR